MIVKAFIGKRLDLEQLQKDIASRDLVGAQFHEAGKFDPDHQIIELVISPGGEYTFAFKLYVSDESICKIERIKFQWECGGWRSEDIVLKRFPVGLNINAPIATEIMEQYLMPSDNSQIT